MKEIEIPEGYTARIDGNKVILEPKESEDERIRKVLLRCCYDWDSGRSSCVTIEDVPAIRAYLEKKKEQKSAELEQLEKVREMTKEIREAYERGIEVGKRIEQKPVEWSEEDIDKMVTARSRKSGTTKSEMEFYRQGIKDTLKSLQPHWKPSEEQMKAVFDASERNDKLGFVLSTLYNDLKKL